MDSREKELAGYPRFQSSAESGRLLRGCRSGPATEGGGGGGGALKESLGKDAPPRPSQPDPG